MWKARNTSMSQDEVIRASGPLVLVTGLLLTLQNPLALESAQEAISLVKTSGWMHSMELRPGNPPPWLDAESLAAEEPEVLVVHGLENREMTRDLDLRARPQRLTPAE